jgi:hypothetical protein
MAVAPFHSFQSFADNLIETSISLDPLLFPQTRLYDMAAFPGYSDGELVDCRIARCVLLDHRTL